MRVVEDTNVVVSALLRGRDPERVLSHLIANADCEWVASEEILAEYRAVLRRPRFALPADLLARWDERFRQAIAVWPVTLPMDFPRDPKDAKFLACALTAEADYFITRDRDFEDAGATFGPVKLVSVGWFVRRFC